MTWRYVGGSAFASATVAAVLDGLYTLGTATTYADGTTRTVGSGSAWTWNRYQNAGTTEACYANPPTDTLTSRVILAGAAALPAPSPTMAAPDTAIPSVLLANVVKNAGSWNAWNAASPFTSGQTFGYWRVWPTTAGTGTVRLYEGIDAVLVLVETSTGTTHGVILGALLDGITTGTPDSETDGKLYGTITSGSASVINTSFNSAANTFGDHGVSNGGIHAGVFTPGGSSLLTMSRRAFCPLSMTTTGMKSRSSRYVRAPLDYRATAAAPNDGALGRLREVQMFGDGKTTTKQTNGGATIGYLVGGSSVTDQDVLMLEHA